MTANEPTTAELQTPPGRGGIAVIRLSGPGGEQILGRVFRPLPSHRLATGPACRNLLRLGKIVDEHGSEIDEAVVCQAGEDWEINIHGGPQAVRSAMEALSRCGVRLLPARTASCDSFTPAHPRWRNPAIGQEMLAALPSCASVLVAAAVSRQWSAGLSQLARQGLAALEDPAPSGQAFAVLADACRQAASALPVMNRLLHPPEVVLVGPPNAGKSTLANALVARAVSIVHERAGTTRDWVRELALIDQAPVYVTDTAGLWEQAADIDAQAVQRSIRCAASADLVLLLFEGDLPPPAWLAGRPVLPVRTKRDLSSGSPSCASDGGCGACASPAAAPVAISAHTGVGMDRLRQAILDRLGLAGVNPSLPMAFTPRQADLLSQAASAIEAGRPDQARHYLHRLCDQSPAGG